ncbi:MAG: hypothetical protein IH911_03430 [Proteobacteria bacterium]|nr:hypothetical protein [Pseudomonadota bacterium]
MPRPDFGSLQAQLLRSGLSPRHVRRTITELDEHFDDLVDEAVANGACVYASEQQALQDLGDVHRIAAVIGERPELRSWAFHHPRIAVLLYPLVCLAVLPAVPLIAGVTNAVYLGRWMACAALSGVVTASIMLFLQLSFALT